MSESSRKLWKAYIHFPYDLTKRHTWEVAKFQYQFICTSTLSSPKLTLDTVPLWSPKTPCTRHVPLVTVDDLALGCKCTHAILQRSAKSSADVQVSADVINVFSLDRPLSSYICLHEPSHVQNSCSKWSLWVLKWHRDQGKDHVRSNVQAAATFSNLDWKTKR